MKNGNDMAFACASDGGHQPGLTKREYFAGLAMQSMAMNWNSDPYHCAKLSVKMADALLIQLESNPLLPKERQ